MTKSIRLFFVHKIIGLLPDTRFFKTKSALLKWAGISIGKNVRICSTAKFFPGSGSISIGSNTWIGHEVFISSGSANISIGEDCDIAPRVNIISGTHCVGVEGSKGAGPGISKPVSIGNGVWLGAASIILPGVSIANGAIIGAGSVVSHSIPKEGIYAGIPAIFKKSKPSNLVP